MFEKVLKNQVENILQHNEQARNSDILLRHLLWREYYSKYLHWDASRSDYFVYFKDEAEIPNQDDIKRIRAKIQNPDPKNNYTGKYPPTVWEVAKKRKWQEDLWRVALGYPAKSSGAIYHKLDAEIKQQQGGLPLNLGPIRYN